MAVSGAYSSELDAVFWLEAMVRTPVFRTLALRKDHRTWNLFLTEKKAHFQLREVGTPGLWQNYADSDSSVARLRRVVQNDYVFR